MGMQFPCRTMLVPITSAWQCLAVITLHSKFFNPSKKKEITVSTSSAEWVSLNAVPILLQCDVMSSLLSTIHGLCLLSLDISLDFLWKIRDLCDQIFLIFWEVLCEKQCVQMASWATMGKLMIIKFWCTKKLTCFRYKYVQCSFMCPVCLISKYACWNSNFKLYGTCSTERLS